MPILRLAESKFPRKLRDYLGVIVISTEAAVTEAKILNRKRDLSGLGVQSRSIQLLKGGYKKAKYKRTASFDVKKMPFTFETETDSTETGSKVSRGRLLWVRRQCGGWLPLRRHRRQRAL
jgi:hypothetical protein